MILRMALLMFDRQHSRPAGPAAVYCPLDEGNDIGHTGLLLDSDTEPVS